MREKVKIIEHILEDLAFDPLCWSLVTQAAEDAGYSTDLAHALFPEKCETVARDISTYFDDAMLDQLAKQDAIQGMTARVTLGVQMRVNAMQTHKEAVKRLTGYWCRPFRLLEGSQALWSTADKIWDWAGDTAQDYNRYTKRGLLCGVLSSTYIYWLQDSSEDQSKTQRFLERRIGNVLSIGKFVSRFKKPSPRSNTGAA